jgi:hypothetical protein
MQRQRVPAHLDRRRVLGLGLGALSLLGATGCATILHPERKGNRSGRIDVGALILDILWFIPGIVPGVIAIAVDFSTGAIYVSRSARDGLEDDASIGRACSAEEPAVPIEVELCLVSARGRVLARSSATWTGGDAPLRVRGEARERAPLSGARVDLRLRRGDETIRLHGAVEDA